MKLTCSTHERNEKCIENFNRKPAGKSREWENNIKSALSYVSRENVKWIHLA
jgi:hypothetical protein